MLSRPNQTAAIAKVVGGVYVWNDGFVAPTSAVPPTPPGPIHVAAGVYRLTLETPLAYPGGATVGDKPGNAVIVTPHGANPRSISYALINPTTIEVYTFISGDPADGDFSVRVEVSPTLRQ